MPGRGGRSRGVRRESGARALALLAITSIGCARDMPPQGGAETSDLSRASASAALPRSGPPLGPPGGHNRVPPTACRTGAEALRLHTYALGRPT